MKKLLFIAGLNPLPACDGGRLGVFLPLKIFAKYFETFFSFYTLLDNDSTYKVYDEMGIKLLPIKKKCKNNYFLYPFSLLSSIPFYFQKYQSKRELKTIIETIEKNNIDIVWMSGIQVANYIKKLKKQFPNVKFYMQEHNIEFDLVKQYAISKKNPIIKFFSYVEYFKTKNFEIKFWKYFDKVFFVSKSDVERAKMFYPDFDSSNVLYHGVFEPSNYQKTSIEKDSFIFSGSLRGFQNKNNLKSFINNVWKDFISKVPDAKLYVTGNKQDVLENKLELNEKKLKDLNIVNLGYVDNIEQEIASKQFVLSPTLFGSGFRMKVLESMAMGKVVFVSDVDYIMADYFEDEINVVHYTPETFYDKYIKLKNNSDLYNNIGQNALQTVKEHFSWNNFIENFMNCLESAEK